MNTSPVRTSAPRIRLLVLDVDGTVTDARHEIPAATRQAVQRARQAGIRVMLATGRRYRDTLPVAAALGIETPLVTASGALVKTPSTHATLHRAAFGPGVIERVVGMIIAAGHEPVLYTDSYAEGFDFHCRQCDLPPAGEPGRGLQEYLARNAGLARLQPDLHAAVPPGVFAGFAMGPQDEMLALEKAIGAACPGQLSAHVIRSPRYRDWLCELAPAGVTKWSGIMAVAREWGLRGDEICAVGDDVNDLPMIRAAGLGIAMGNAVAEVQAAADRVVGTSDAAGIADVVEMVLAGLA